MSDVVDYLKAYPDDPAAVMSRAMLKEAIDEIVRLRAELAAEREKVAFLSSQVDKLKAECARRRATVERLYAEHGKRR